MKFLKTGLAILLVSQYAEARFFRGSVLKDSNSGLVSGSSASHTKVSSLNDDEAIKHLTRIVIQETSRFRFGGEDAPVEASTFTANILRENKKFIWTFGSAIGGISYAGKAVQGDKYLQFCGADRANMLPTSVDNIMKSSTNNIFEADNNFWGYDGVLTDKNTTKDKENDAIQCESHKCTSGSIVDKMSRTIRAKGLHVRHDDICKARARIQDGAAEGGIGEKIIPEDVSNKVLVPVDNCHLRSLDARNVYQCSQSTATIKFDYHDYLQECQDAFATGVAKDCTDYSGSKTGLTSVIECQLADRKNSVDSSARDCVPTDAAMLDRACTKNPVMSIPAFTVGDYGVFQRSTRYAIPNDKTIDGGYHNLELDIVGTIGSTDGCRSFRGLNMARSGSIHQFLKHDKEHSTELVRWDKEIQIIKKLVETAIAQVRTETKRDELYNVPKIGVTASEAFLSIDIATVPATFQKSHHSDVHRGSSDNSFCGLKLSVDDILAQAPTDAKASRRECLCRGSPSKAGFAASDAYATSSSIYNFDAGFDELYLRANQTTGVTCDFKTTSGKTLFSVNSYCETIKKDTEKPQLEDWDLKVRSLYLHLRTNEDTTAYIPGSFTADQKNTIRNNIKGSLGVTGPDGTLGAPGTSIVEGKCGRIVNAKGPASTSLVRLSNVGWNFIPVVDAAAAHGLEDVIYQLEAESINNRRKLANGTHPVNFADYMCKLEGIGETQPDGSGQGSKLFSFHQLAHSWSEFEHDSSRDHTRTANEALDAADRAQIYHVSTTESECIVDWELELLYKANEPVPESYEDGVFIMDPIGKDAREILEIGYNLKLTDIARQRAKNAKTEVEKYTKSQLESDGKTIASDIGEEVGLHYLRVAALTGALFPGAGKGDLISR